MDLFKSKLFRDDKTFKPKRSYLPGSSRDRLHEYVVKTLGSGDLRQAVKLPEGENLYEWLAVNTVDFFNQINLLYGSIAEFCNDETCPIMNAGKKYEYFWADGKNIKSPIKCSAPAYMEHLMTWVQEQLDDETIFPSRVDVDFPSNFVDIIKNIYKRLFRVYAHIYHAHLETIESLGEQKHLNTCFKHYLMFSLEFQLIDKKEMAPLAKLIEQFEQRP